MTGSRARRLLLAAGMGWQEDAACIDAPGVDFFVKSRFLKKVEAAKKVCRKCAVRRECLDFAVAHDEDGIWGGTTREERGFVHAYLRAVELSSSILSNTSREPAHQTRASPSSPVHTFSLEIHIPGVSLSASATHSQFCFVVPGLPAPQSVEAQSPYPPDVNAHTPSGLSRSSHTLLDQPPALFAGRKPEQAHTNEPPSSQSRYPELTFAFQLHPG